MKRIINAAVLLILMTAYIPSKAQQVSDVLENSLSSVVTVVVYETTDLSMVLGMRGDVDENVANAYERFLDLSGAVGSGSGFVIDWRGKKYVITNSHVIENAAETDGSIAIFSITQEKYRVRVVGGDTFYDFAILEFLDNPGNEITTIDLADANPRIGEKVYAIGNPLGEYPYSVSDGIVSAKNRTRGGLTGKFGFLQTTATVIWGNSGGPLVNTNGEVVGINSQIAFATGHDGRPVWQSQINFALEVEIVKSLITDVLGNDGRVARSFYGIMVAENYQADYYYGYYEKVEGPFINYVFEDSPLYDKLSPYVGKTISGINGNEVRNINELLGELERLKPGSSTTFEFQGGQKVTVRSGELNYDALKSIASNLIANDPTMSLDDNATGVYLYYDSPEAYFSSTNNSDRYELQENKTEGFQFLAAGFVEESNLVMYRIDDLADLGAAIRLTSLLGYLDFYGYSPDYSDPQLIRHNFNTSEDVISSVLYY